MAPDGTELKAGELLGRANQVVHALRQLGLRPGDTIAFVLPNCAEVFEIYLAALQAGWYIVPINHHLVAPEIAYIVKDSGAQVFIGHERFADACLDAADEAEIPASRCLAVGDIPGFASYAQLRDNQRTDRPDDRSLGDTMNYTSGTTGNPKGVRRTLSGADPDDMAIGLAGILLLFGIQPRDDNVHIVGSPLYHTAVLRFSGAAIHMGHTVVLMDKWNAEEMLELIEQYRVTHSHMVPTQFHRLLALPDDVRTQVRPVVAAPHDPRRGPVPGRHQARHDRVVGPGDRRVLRRVRGRRHHRQHRGVAQQARHGGQALADLGDRHLRRRRQPARGQPDRHRLHGHAVGGLRVPQDKEKTQKNRIGNFFTVGDVGYLDDDGYLFLCDRKTDMIISGGANIYPAEIESVLLGHPKIVDVAVFGIPHDDWGEEVKAVVQPVDGVDGSPELAAEILAWCEGRLAQFKTPKTIDFTDDMPRDPNGKLYKRKLRDPYWEGRERAI